MIVLIVLAALCLRLINLNQSLWLDEAISFTAVKNFDYAGIVTRFAPGDVHPPLYYLLLKVWTSVFGYSEISLRLPSVAAGVLTVFFVYLIGKKLFSHRVGLLAAAFLAVSPLAVYYSQEARMYSLAALAVSMAVYFFLTKKWFWYFLFFLTAVYLDYFPLLLLPVFLPSSLLVLVCLLPWLPILWQQLTASLSLAKDVPLWGQVVGGLDPKSIVLLPIKFIFGRIPTQWWFAFPSLIYLWSLSRAKSIFLWSWLLVPILLGILISIKIPIFTYHRFLFVLPAFCLLLASKAGKKSATAIVLISLFSLAVFNLSPNLQREDWRAAITYMQAKPGLVVMPSLAQAAAINYYAPKQMLAGPALTYPEIADDVYLVRYVQEIFDPQDLGRYNLEKLGYRRVEERTFSGGLLIWHYQY